jgi:hypothetical protein
MPDFIQNLWNGSSELAKASLRINPNMIEAYFPIAQGKLNVTRAYY